MGGRRERSRRQVVGGAAGLGGALLLPPAATARTEPMSAAERRRAFPLIARGQPATVLVDAEADSAVRHVAESFAADLGRVSGSAPAAPVSALPASGAVVVIGVLGQSAILDRLVAAGRLDVAGLSGEWEAFRRVVVEHPFPGVARALVIVGSDRRGAVFGAYDLSERIGVSPWHWFADVPVARRQTLLIPATPVSDRPRVKYRGFFINDEDPSFSGWAKAKFGGINAAMYAHVFELLLRMKGNYLWPAMWAPKAFAADDPQNIVLADAMGVVMGSSHHEVMGRAQDEWHRDTDKGVTGGAWDYTKNAANLRRFWRGGIERMMSKPGGRYDAVVTIGMRGDGDEAMVEGTATQLLERIVADQRSIIADVTGRPAAETPQVWALYKEVQDYYDHGMQVPDDVTLLFADDNWGQIRRLPGLGAKPRAGGYGVYYHFDYVGGPRNYKWLNTNQIGKVWQQMDLAYARGARAMWIVNVGDIKPMEYPLGFFMAMAWNPEAMTPAALAAYPEQWATATFGPEQAQAIGRAMTDYSRLAARRKPELIDQDSFPLGEIARDALDGGEFGAMVAEWDRLEAGTRAIADRLRPDQQDAWFQLCGFPVAAMANLYRLHYATAWNRKLAARNDPRANAFADQVEATFARDGALTAAYHAMNGGKWAGMMAQVHMNYVIWNDPVRQTIPSIVRVGGDTPTEERGRGPRFQARAPAPEGVIALAASSFARSQPGAGLRWTTVPDLGRTGDAVVALPQGGGATDPGAGVRLDYALTVTRGGPARVQLVLAPTLDVEGAGRSRIGVSLDDGPVQVLSAELQATGGPSDDGAKKRWADAVSDNAVWLTAELGAVLPGRHWLRVWRLDDNVVLQKLVFATVPVPPSYLGPPTG
jgi:hypothetical protein